MLNKVLGPQFHLKLRVLCYYYSSNLYIFVFRNLEICAFCCKYSFSFHKTDISIRFACQNPARCCHIDRTNSFIAVGCTAGALTVFHLSDRLTSSKQLFQVDEVAYRKDCKAECTVVKFSPSNDMVSEQFRSSIFLTLILLIKI